MAAKKDPIAHLRGALTDADVALAAQIGEDKDKSEDELVTALFDSLPDPLLSAADVKALLGFRPALAKVQDRLQNLTKRGLLESSSDTQRPLDKAGTELFRSTKTGFERLKLLALQEELVGGRSRFQFGLEGRLVRSIARVQRLDAVQGRGQQRKEIAAHVERIAEGIIQGTRVPNPILLIMLEATTVEQELEEEADVPESFTVIRAVEEFIDVPLPTLAGSGDAQRTRLVEIDMPYRHAAFDDEKSILLVDGQQRTAALARVPLDTKPVVPLTVNAEIGDEDAAQEAFAVANDTVKIALDQKLVLAAIRTDVPAAQKQDKLQTEACLILALRDKTSPFYELAKVPGAPAEGRVIAFISLFEVVQIFRNAVLPQTGDPKELAEVVSRSFKIVASLWPEAWSRKPSESRLTHGAGLRAVATVLAKLVSSQQIALGTPALRKDKTWKQIADRFGLLGDAVAWTTDDALKGTKLAKQNYTEHIQDAQNTRQDIEELSIFLWAEWQKLDAASTSAK